MLGYQRGISLREIKAIRAVRRGRNPGSRRGNISIRRRHPPRRRGNQYAAASRFNHWRLWNTGSPKHPKPSLRAKRSNPFFCAARWIAFVASLLAMTVDMVSHSRGATRPSFAGNFRVPPIRGRREDRVRAAPAVPCAMCTKSARMSIQVQRRASGLPCAMALRLITCSPRRTALLPP